MSKEEIYDTMWDSEEHNVEITTKTGNTITGYVDLFESRDDNSDDDVNPGEASVSILGKDKGTEWGCVVYEDDIQTIRITD